MASGFLVRQAFEPDGGAVCQAAGYGFVRLESLTYNTQQQTRREGTPFYKFFGGSAALHYSWVSFFASCEDLLGQANVPQGQP
jgi:hypothetical protein